ncbi:adhesion G protein-coupled receptor E4P, partial [Biomphalaria glabrata]
VFMVAPLSLVFLCNLTFLMITVVSIYRVNTLMTFDAIKKDQYQNLILYVKLSTVTSVYWIVTIVAEAVDSDIL